MTHHSERPLAAPGLISYRYFNGVWGWVMIGATDNADALRQAARSIDGEPSWSNLWRWNDDAGEYRPVLVKS